MRVKFTVDVPDIEHAKEIMKFVVSKYKGKKELAYTEFIKGTEHMNEQELKDLFTEIYGGEWQELMKIKKETNGKNKKFDWNKSVFADVLSKKLPKKVQKHMSNIDLENIFAKAIIEKDFYQMVELFRFALWWKLLLQERSHYLSETLREAQTGKIKIIEDIDEQILKWEKRFKKYNLKENSHEFVKTKLVIIVLERLKAKWDK